MSTDLVSLMLSEASARTLVVLGVDGWKYQCDVKQPHDIPYYVMSRGTHTLQVLRLARETSRHGSQTDKARTTKQHDCPKTYVSAASCEKHAEMLLFNTAV